MEIDPASNATNLHFSSPKVNNIHCAVLFDELLHHHINQLSAPSNLPPLKSFLLLLEPR